MSYSTNYHFTITSLKNIYDSVAELQDKDKMEETLSNIDTQISNLARLPDKNLVNNLNSFKNSVHDLSKKKISTQDVQKLQGAVIAFDTMAKGSLMKTDVPSRTQSPATTPSSSVPSSRVTSPTSSAEPSPKASRSNSISEERISSAQEEMMGPFLPDVDQLYIEVTNRPNFYEDAEMVVAGLGNEKDGAYAFSEPSDEKNREFYTFSLFVKGRNGVEEYVCTASVNGFSAVPQRVDKDVTGEVYSTIEDLVSAKGGKVAFDKI